KLLRSQMTVEKPEADAAAEAAAAPVAKLRVSNPKEELLCQAAEDGDCKTIGKLISEIENVELKWPRLENVNCLDALGRTALMRASQAGHYEAVKLLVANGADVNYRDWNGVTALHLAAKHHQLQVVKFLIMSEARLDALTRTGLAPIDLARYNSDTWTVLRQAATGTMPTVDHLVQTIEVPLVPAYAIPKPKSGDGKKKGKKGGKKSGKKGKKGGKKKKK
ncbi:hypothetical protein BOX15_Mlig010693g2, partial [Macrostomum lignano]